MFQKHLLKWIHNSVDLPHVRGGLADSLHLVLTNHETSHCMKTVLVLSSRVSTISGRESFNNSVHFFKHLLSIYCGTDTATTQVKWNMI